MLSHRKRQQGEHDLRHLMAANSLIISVSAASLWPLGGELWGQNVLLFLQRSLAPRCSKKPQGKPADPAPKNIPAAELMAADTTPPLIYPYPSYFTEERLKSILSYIETLGQPEDISRPLSSLPLSLCFFPSCATSVKCLIGEKYAMILRKCEYQCLLWRRAAHSRWMGLCSDRDGDRWMDFRMDKAKRSLMRTSVA